MFRTLVRSWRRIGNPTARERSASQVGVPRAVVPRRGPTNGRVEPPVENPTFAPVSMDEVRHSFNDSRIMEDLAMAEAGSCEHATVWPMAGVTGRALDVDVLVEIVMHDEERSAHLSAKVLHALRIEVQARRARHSALESQFSAFTNPGYACEHSGSAVNTVGCRDVDE